MASEPTANEIVALMRADPDDVLRAHQERLRELRDEVESLRLQTVIDVVLESYQREGGVDE